jgi:hypothetical protein
VASIVDVRGSWQKMDDRLPPIALDITEAGAAMRVRLRLSGVGWMASSRERLRRSCCGFRAPWGSGR